MNAASPVDILLVAYGDMVLKMYSMHVRMAGWTGTQTEQASNVTPLVILCRVKTKNVTFSKCTGLK